MQQDLPGPDLSGAVPFAPVTDITPAILKILTVFFLFTLLFTTIGIAMINAWIHQLDDVQWIILILVPWMLFILLLSTAFVYQVLRSLVLLRHTL